MLWPATSILKLKNVLGLTYDSEKWAVASLVTIASERKRGARKIETHLVGTCRHLHILLLAGKEKSLFYFVSNHEFVGFFTFLLVFESYTPQLIRIDCCWGLWRGQASNRCGRKHTIVRTWQVFPTWKEFWGCLGLNVISSRRCSSTV